jgi:hypothetical protein
MRLKMTNEEIAIRQHLSKPRPNCNACGCMGPQPINGAMCSQETEKFEISLHDSSDIKKVAIAIQKSLELGLAESLKLARTKRFTIESLFKWMLFNKHLNDPTQVYVTQTGPRYEPDCPCGMKWVEKVDGGYYRVIERRSSEGVKYTAKWLGPFGGPYVKE